MCDFITQSSTLTFLEQFTNSVILCSAKWYLGAHWGLWWKRKYNQIKTGVKPSEKLHFDVWIHLIEFHLCFMQQSIITVFEEPEKTSLDRVEVCADKGYIISSKREWSFLRNYFVICEFLSECYSLVLRKQFANTLFVESAKRDLGAHTGPWWKRKYPQIISREKVSERLLSDVWLNHTEFHPSLLGKLC